MTQYDRVTSSTKLPFGTRTSTSSPWVSKSITYQNVSTMYGLNNGRSYRERLGKGDVGGPWDLSKVEYRISPILANNSLFRGATWAERAQTWSTTPDMVVDPAEVIRLGTKAIGLASPNDPNAGMAVFLAEAREGIPKIAGAGLWKEKSRFLKGSSSEYLNLEFGWKPMISDILSFARSVRDHHEVIEQWHAGSGQKIRRRHVYPVDSTFTQGAETGAIQYPASVGMPNIRATTSERKVHRSWFSGAFRYHVPMGDDQLSKARRMYSDAGKLLGLRLTPDVLWNAAPWTWAADWFGNTGDIMTNISNLGQDGLVMQYGYMMVSVEKSTETSFRVISNGTVGATGSFGRYQSHKVRTPASPYGFATTFDGLSTRQKAICAALGISRRR